MRVLFAAFCLVTLVVTLLTLNLLEKLVTLNH